METNPRAAFERIFGRGGNAEERAERLARQKSLLDSISEEAAGLRAALGPRDRQRLGDYLDNIREIERRIQQIERRNAADASAPAAPLGVPDSFDEHVDLMFDLAAAAWQADVTRVFTFMMSRELSQRTYPQIGVTEQHHSVSHHQNNADKMAKMATVNTYYIGFFARFLEKLRALKEGGESLLDSALLVYGAGMADSNLHASDPLPIVMVGGGVGQGHRHIQVPVRTPVGCLWSTVAAQFGGPPIERYGDGEGTVDGIF
jgi:hypothetical protein